MAERQPPSMFDFNMPLISNALFTIKSSPNTTSYMGNGATIYFKCTCPQFHRRDSLMVFMTPCAILAPAFSQDDKSS